MSPADHGTGRVGRRGFPRRAAVAGTGPAVGGAAAPDRAAATGAYRTSRRRRGATA
ncbi:hypothetical protein ACFV3E_13940 [Streptomyces sp. NPDC059718]